MASPRPKPVYALVGADSFVQLLKLRQILSTLPADIQRIDVDGERAELAEVLDEVRSFAMFGGGKCVVVRDADDFISKFRGQLEDYCSSPSDSATLIFRVQSMPKNVRIYKAILKTGQIEECEPPKDLRKWIVDHALATHRVQIAPNAATQLADLIGADLGRLDTELAKLALAADGKIIQTQHIGQAVAFQREQKMWDMTNALAAGNSTEALRRWRHLLASEPASEFRAVTWLGIWLENVRKSLFMKKQGVNSFTIAQQLRIYPRELIAPFFKTAEALGDAGVSRALDLLVEIDRQSKSGIGEAATNVERFILQMKVGC